MSRRKKNKRRSKTQKRNSIGRDMGFRGLTVRAASFDEEARTVEAVISTEAPVPMPDWERMEMIPEVLLTSGVDMPDSRQVPFLDSHNRFSVKDQLGSARSISVEDQEVRATLHFSKQDHGESALGDVRDGHITDVSVGYEVLERTHIGHGEAQVVEGRSFEGPMNVATKWRLREVSLTPIGADDQAKLRGLDPAAVRFQSTDEDEFQMNEELRKLLESRGMPATLTDEEAQRWMIENIGDLKEPDDNTRSGGTGLDVDELKRMITSATADVLKQREEQRAAFEREVSTLCDLVDLPDEYEACRLLSDVDAVREHLQKAKKEREESIPYGGGAVVRSSGIDRLKTDLRSVLTLKAVRSAVNGDESLVEKHLPDVKDVEDFRHATLLDMATEFVRCQGIQVLGLTREQIAKCAMFGPDAAGIRSFRGSNPYHTTGSFANLTLDAINKSMMIGYTEVPATWRGPMRQAESTPDFKQIHRMRLGGVPNLPAWNDTDAPERASMADAKESYAVEARSIGVDFGYKLIVNDDMSALTRIPQALGDSAARTVNAVAWSQVTSNPKMEDGQNLFSIKAGKRFRKNLTSGAGVPTVETVGELTDNMRQMRGENTPEGKEGADILNLSPSYLVVPSALETKANQLVNSAYDPDANVNTQVFNPTRTLMPVVEPLLDSDSRTAWYLFSNPTRIDTVEVTFLQGQETPLVRSVMDEHTLAMTYYVLQCVGAKAMNFRGVQKHAGA